MKLLKIIYFLAVHFILNAHGVWNPIPASPAVMASAGNGLKENEMELVLLHVLYSKKVFKCKLFQMMYPLSLHFNLNIFQNFTIMNILFGAWFILKKVNSRFRLG